MSNDDFPIDEPRLGRFLTRLRQALDAQTLQRLRLNRPVGEPELLRVDARPIRLRGQPVLSFVWHYRRRVETHNQPIGAALDWLAGQLGHRFQAAVLTTDRDEVELGFSRKGKALLRSRARHDAASGSGAAGIQPGSANPAAQDHNRSKPRWLDAGRPFLAALGVTDASGAVVPAMARKWRQIDRFVEIFVGAWREARLDPAIGTPARPIRIVDLGAGKGYLTFALYDYLVGTGLAVRMTGVERRQDLVDSGNRTAAALGFSGLDFVAGDIIACADEAAIDVMIALHACDTATDDALYRGMAAGAAILVCSPCCHKELRPQLLTPGPLRPLLRHGIQRGEMADMVTDTMRALLLETRGYDARIFEFVALEHTARNRMILAVRAPDADRPVRAREQLDGLRTFYGVREQRLETLLYGTAGGGID